MFKFKSKAQKTNEKNYQINISKRMCMRETITSADNMFKQVVRLNVLDISSHKNGTHIVVTPTLRCRFTGLTCNNNCTTCLVQQRYPAQRKKLTEVRIEEARKIRNIW